VQLKVGDLVRFRNCAQQGKLGMITCVPERSYLAQSNPMLALYWVAFNGERQCFTGNQLELISESG